MRGWRGRAWGVESKVLKGDDSMLQYNSIAA